MIVKSTASATVPGCSAAILATDAAPLRVVAQLLEAWAQWAKHVAARDGAAHSRRWGATLEEMILTIMKQPGGESLMRYHARGGTVSGANKQLAAVGVSFCSRSDHG